MEFKIATSDKGYYGEFLYRTGMNTTAFCCYPDKLTVMDLLNLIAFFVNYLKSVTED
jgi:hypothetical protein